MLPTVLPWIQAFIWAFKPTDIVDIRRFPQEEAKAIDEEIVAQGRSARAPGTRATVPRRRRATAVEPPAPTAAERRPDGHPCCSDSSCCSATVHRLAGLLQVRWLKFTIAWGFVLAFFGLHLLIIFMIGLRFVTPLSTEAKVIQHTIQLVPRLPEPTLVTAVLVEPNVPVNKGQPLFQFDRRPYEYKVRQLEAQLAKAKQNVLVLKADTQVNAQKIAKLKADLEYAKYQLKLSTDWRRRARSGRGRAEVGGAGRRRRGRHQGGAGRRHARNCATRPRSTASTRPSRRSRPSSTRRATTSTTR